MVPLEEVRASLLTIVTPEGTRRERRRSRGEDTEGGRVENSDGHGEGEEVRLEDKREES